MILADAQPSAGAANLRWQILEIAAVVSGIICPIIMVIFMRSDKKQRREVSFEFEPLSKKEFEVARQQRDEEFKALAALVERNRSEAETSRKSSADGIYKKLEATRLEMKQDLNLQTIALSERIEGMPGQIVTLLKNTNAI